MATLTASPILGRVTTLIRNFFLYGIVTWIIFFLVGSILGPLSFLLVITRRVRIKGWTNIWKAGWKNVVWTANHPSYLDLWLPLVLLWPCIVIWPFKFAPWQMPDMRNFKLLLNFRIFRGIAIDRTSGKSFGVIREVHRVLPNNVLLIFPETGRTSSDPTSRLSGLPKGVQMRIPSTGIAKIVSTKPDPTILPIHIQGTEQVLSRGQWLPKFWKGPIRITIGNPYRLEQLSAQSMNKEEKQAVADEIMTRVGMLF